MTKTKTIPLGPVSPEEMREELGAFVEHNRMGPAFALGLVAELADILQFSPALGGLGGDWRIRFQGHLNAIERAIEQLDFTTEKED